MTQSYDVVIIGAGPGGYVCAIRAAQLGLKTAIIEREKLGGICLNWGCIPTKALLRSAEILRNIKHASEFGIGVKSVKPDLNAMVKRSRAVSDQLTDGIGYLMKKNGIKVITGEAAFKNKGVLDVVTKNGKSITISGKNIVIATGARARNLPNIKIDGEIVWAYRQAVRPNVLPKKLLVVGSGAIGVEFASFYNELGTNVNIVEVLDRILPNEDADVSQHAKTAFEKQGMKIHTKAKLSKLVIKDDAAEAVITLDNGKSVKETYDRVIMAVGVCGNIENMELDRMGIKTARGFITVDEFGASNMPGVWAIGDVAGPPCLAHKASHEGVMVAEKIAGQTVHPMDVMNIPGCTYSHPQIASVGLTEAKATEQGYSIKIGMFPFQGNGKAIALGESEGFIKTVVDAKTGELLGAHMIGAEVTELIQGYVVARTLESTTEELIQTVFAHPTLSEMMHEAVLDAEGRALHI